MFISWFLQWLIRLLIGAYPRWLGCKPIAKQRIYFANHTSHIDTLAIWAALPPHLQKTTHPVAAFDYWGKNAFKKYIVTEGLNAVFIARAREDRTEDDPLQPLYDTLAKGDSLIIFPEGTRNKGSTPQPFKSGIYHLAQKFPEVELVPVYLENLNRIMPKGAFWPVPLVCTARFGTPLFLGADEDKDEFLERARQAVISARAQHQQLAVGDA
jgi:1-acyl-sn-glycerol-3-phosphate acyltransferase